MKSHILENHPIPKIFLTGIFLILGFATVAQAQEGQVCIPQLGLDPAAFNVFPTIDGVVEEFPDPTQPSGFKSDLGWNGAAKINLNTSTSGTPRTARLLLGQDANFVYLALEIEYFTIPTTGGIQAGADNTVIIALSTDGVPANDWRIQIKPFDMGTAGSSLVPGQLPNQIRFSRNSGTTGTAWNAAGSLQTALPGDWLHPAQNNIFISKDGDFWYLEMKIPRENVATNAHLNTKVYFPTGASDPSDTFRLYVDVLSTSTVPDPSLMTGIVVYQNAWPTWSQARIPGVLAPPFEVERNTPAKDSGSTPIWGTASLFPRSPCTGISLTWDKVGVLDPLDLTAPPISNIRAFDPTPNPFQSVAACTAINDSDSSLSTFGDNGPENILVAQPTNSMPTTSPASMNVRFKIANWGIPSFGDWQPVTGRITSGITTPPDTLIGPNPTSLPTQPAAGGGTGQFELRWRLSYKQSCLYRQSVVPWLAHQCIWVEMDDPLESNVRFLNKSVTRNMDFVPASKFSQVAEISARGYKLPAGRTKQNFIIWVDKEIQTYSSPNLPKTMGLKVSHKPKLVHPRLESGLIRSLAPKYFPNGVSEGLVWIARGFRMTGRFIQINDKKYEYAEEVGGFGYVAGHNGEVTKWEQSFTGQGLTQLSGDVYTLAVPPESVARVTTIIEAVEPGGPQPPSGFKRWGLSLQGGLSIPHGNFNNVFNPGPNLGVDLEYRLTPTFSLEGIYTYHRFNGETFGSFTVPDLNLHQFSVNGKIYGNTSPVRPFFNFGGGAYVFTPGATTRGGLNVGGGVQFDVNPNVAFDAMYNYHNVFTSGSNTAFSTAQVGVRFRF